MGKRRASHHSTDHELEDQVKEPLMLVDLGSNPAYSFAVVSIAIHLVLGGRVGQHDRLPPCSGWSLSPKKISGWAERLRSLQEVHRVRGTLEKMCLNEAIKASADSKIAIFYILGGF